MANKIAGSVYWIEKGRQTSRVVDAEEAFSDPEQAKAQIKDALSSRDSKQLKLARLAYRQYQGKRFRAAGAEKTKIHTDKKVATRRPSKAKAKKNTHSNRK